MANKLLVLVCQIVPQHGRLSDIRAASDKIYIITSVRHKNYSTTIVIAFSKWFTACVLILSYLILLFEFVLFLRGTLIHSYNNYIIHNNLSHPFLSIFFIYRSCFVSWLLCFGIYYSILAHRARLQSLVRLVCLSSCVIFYLRLISFSVRHPLRLRSRSNYLISIVQQGTPNLIHIS